MAKRKQKRRGEFPPPPTDKPHQCEFCGHNYRTEKLLINHTCKFRLRWSWRDNRDYKLALQVYKQFYSTQMRQEVDYEDFMYSTYFDAFVRFANHIIHNNITEPNKFIDFVLKHNIRLDDWCSDATYELYIRHYVENEPPLRAAERNVLLMMQEAADGEYHWTEFFDNVPTPRVVQLVKTGRLSPWIIYALESARTRLLPRLSPEQLMLVDQYAPITTWKKKFTIRQQDLNEVRDIFAKAGL